jgi:hypothetical protein
VQITKDPNMDTSSIQQETKGTTDTTSSTKKLTCQFTPLDKMTANILSSRSINPRLQLIILFILF